MLQDAWRIRKRVYGFLALRDRTKPKKLLKDLPVTPIVSEPCIVFTCHFWD